MANSSAKKVPGPAGRTPSELPDGLSLGVPRLEFALDRATDWQIDQWRIMEAFRRGAQRIEIFVLLARSRESFRKTAKSTSAAPSLLGGNGLISMDPELEYQDMLGNLIAQAETAYQNEVKREFDSLPEDVQRAFSFEGGSLYNYFRIRPAYYNAGYDDPAGAIFTKMRTATLAGKNVVSPGVHQKLAEKLPTVDQFLNQCEPGLALKMGQLIRSVGGFVPRYIAPRQGQNFGPVLSNHALGLAIDIDPSGNPHIKDKDVIKILNEIAKKSGIDYGGSIMERGELPAEVWAAGMHKRAQSASDLVKVWLSKYLPVFEAQEERARLELEAAHAKTAAAKELILNKLSGNSTNPMSPALSVDEQDAIQKIKTLKKYHPISEIKGWAVLGIQTIPQLLAVALIKAGLRWGQSYHDTKDAMHFELVDDHGRAVVGPESHPRNVDELFPIGGAMAPVIKGGGKSSAKHAN
jgi:hypothetical protein